MAKYDVSLHYPSLREWYEQVIKDPSLLRDYARKEAWFLANASYHFEHRNRPKRKPLDVAGQWSYIPVISKGNQARLKRKIDR